MLFFFFFFFCFGFWFCFLFFLAGFLCVTHSSGCPGSSSVDQAGLELTEIPASASQVLALNMGHLKGLNSTQFELSLKYTLFTPELGLEPLSNPSTAWAPEKDSEQRACVYLPEETQGPL